MVPETNILLLRVTADDPISAFRTLRFWLDNYDTVSQHVFQNVVLRELDAPSVPRAPSNPLHLGSAVKRAFVLGAAAMTLALLALAVLSDTVQTSDAMRHKVDARLFATIHHEEKNKTLRSRLKRSNKKKGLLITMPATGFYFTEEIEKLASKVNHSAQRNNGKVLLVTSVAENEGKSTVAANLALSLAKQDKKVLLIDADLHKASQYKLFGRENAPELSRMLAGSQPVQAEYLERKTFTPFSPSAPAPEPPSCWPLPRCGSCWRRCGRRWISSLSTPRPWPCSPTRRRWRTRRIFPCWWCGRTASARRGSTTRWTR